MSGIEFISSKHQVAVAMAPFLDLREAVVSF